MPYTINRYNGQVIATVSDGTIDSSTDLKMIGKNYAGYGEVQNENFIFLLENFANTTQPPRPLSGQLWFDSGNSKLKFFDGSKFRTTGGAEVSNSAPTGLTIGDFWWDTQNKQLYTWDGNQYILVGPQGVAGSQTTQMRSRSVRDTLGASHAIIESIVDGDTIFVVSADSAFTLDPNTSPITGFSRIQKGVTLAYTSDSNNLGVTTADHRFWGTSSNAERLGGDPASEFVKKGNAVFNTQVQFSDAGFTVGDTPRLRVFNSISGSTSFPVIQNQLNDTIRFQTTVTTGSGEATRTPLQLVGNNILPGNDNQTDIGSGQLRFKTINAVTFNGTATRADALYVAQDDYRAASSAASSGSVAVRTSVAEQVFGVNTTPGSLKATFFIGTATAANYADLAEKYLADAEYEVGTVVTVGGEKEVTACKFGDRALGAVSANPAYLMNLELENGTPVALKGRVPVKVVGAVKKGARMVASDNGCAIAASFHQHPDVFAIALESSDDVGVKLVECIIL
jgi:hypothetical protein